MSIALLLVSACHTPVVPPEAPHPTQSVPPKLTLGGLELSSDTCDVDIHCGGALTLERYEHSDYGVEKDDTSVTPATTLVAKSLQNGIDTYLCVPDYSSLEDEMSTLVSQATSRYPYLRLSNRDYKHTDCRAGTTYLAPETSFFQTNNALPANTSVALWPFSEAKDFGEMLCSLAEVDDKTFRQTVIFDMFTNPLVGVMDLAMAPDGDKTLDGNLSSYLVTSTLDLADAISNDAGQSAGEGLQSGLFASLGLEEAVLADVPFVDIISTLALVTDTLIISHLNFYGTRSAFEDNMLSDSTIGMSWNANQWGGTPMNLFTYTDFDPWYTFLDNDRTASLLVTGAPSQVKPVNGALPSCQTNSSSNVGVKVDAQFQTSKSGPIAFQIKRPGDKAWSQYAHEVTENGQGLWTMSDPGLEVLTAGATYRFVEDVTPWRPVSATWVISDEEISQQISPPVLDQAATPTVTLYNYTQQEGVLVYSFVTSPIQDAENDNAALSPTVVRSTKVVPARSGDTPGSVTHVTTEGVAAMWLEDKDMNPISQVVYPSYQLEKGYEVMFGYAPDLCPRGRNFMVIAGLEPGNPAYQGTSDDPTLNVEGVVWSGTVQSERSYEMFNRTANVDDASPEYDLVATRAWSFEHPTHNYTSCVD